jgi:predicted amidohydrolase
MTIVATCAFAGSLDPAVNLASHLSYIDEAAAAGAQLVVFPECGLHGYPDRSARTTSAGLQETWAGAETITGGPRSRAIIAHAIHRRIHVVYGLNEASDTIGAIYNTAVLTGPDGVVGSYRKVHLGNAERSTWLPGDHWPVFDTPIGRIGLLICADKAWPESTRELTLGGAELLVMPTAWAFAIDTEPATAIDPRWAHYYQLFDRARAAENSRWFISSNYLGHLGDTSYGGYSQIVDPIGTVIASSQQRHGLVLADIDIAGRIAEAEAAWLGPRLLRDRRPDTYRRQSAPPEQRSNDEHARER